MTISRQCTPAEFIKRNGEILLTASAGSGHIGPIVSLARLLLAESLSITLAMPIAVDGSLPTNLPDSPSFRVVRVDMPAGAASFAEGFDYLRSEQKKIASDIILKCGYSQSRPAVLVSDMMAGVWDAALCGALQVPHYIFFPSPLTCVYLFQHLGDWKDLRAAAAPNDEIAFYFPGIRNAVNGSDCPELPPDWDEAFSQIFKSFHLAEGGIVQDLERLYPRPRPLIDSIEHHFKAECDRDGLTNREAFKLYNVGALCLFDTHLKQADSCPELEWLDRQEPRSVVFAALGSWLQITVADTIELARGLELSGMKFIWAYRGHTTGNALDAEREALEEVDETGLPITFRSEVKDSGLVLPWVNQPAVLKHPAVACFLTHCGWNSTMESLALAGVPLILMPVGAEQGINACVLEEEWKCGKKVWDMHRGRQLERHHVANVIKECASDEALRQMAEERKRLLNKAVAPGGCVLETRTELCANLLRARHNDQKQ